MNIFFRRILPIAALTLTVVAPIAPGVAHAAAPEPGAYRLLNYRRVQCPAGRSDNLVSLADCPDNSTDQVWLIEALPLAGYYRFRNRVRNKCLAFPSGEDGSDAKIVDCVDAFDDQWWKFDPTSAPNAFELRNHRRNKCLVGRSTNGRVTESACTLNFTEQWWYFVPSS